ncbi:hypothetical protein [Paenibacillus amylolyticus]|uniref:hypothetical protein n=1 Tax=Paenibacillus amylolyticus TaxID=1451 RepID=UPI000B85FA2F|nr:hypothetical protein [Paenibacillus amylolyticus]
MNSIGIRVSPSEVNYCITEKTDGGVSILGYDKIIIPKALDVPSQLAYVRTNLNSIFTEFEIVKAGIRVHEGNTKNISIERIYLEGVIQELLADCTVHKYFLGKLASIAKLIEQPLAKVKEYIEGDDTLIAIEGVTKSAKEVRESIVTAFAASELEIEVITQ